MKRISITQSKGIRKWGQESPQNGLKVLDAISFAFDLQKFALGDSSVAKKYAQADWIFYKDSRFIETVRKCHRMTVSVHDSRFETPNMGVGAVTVLIQCFDEKGELGNDTTLSCLFHSFSSSGRLPEISTMSVWDGKIEPVRRPRY